MDLFITSWAFGLKPFLTEVKQQFFFLCLTFCEISSNFVLERALCSFRIVNLTMFAIE